MVLTDDEQLDIKWAAPDEEVINFVVEKIWLFGMLYELQYIMYLVLQGLITFLVNENGFSSDRVTKV